jgi:hypothetical protein
VKGAVLTTWSTSAHFAPMLPPMYRPVQLKSGTTGTTGRTPRSAALALDTAASARPASAVVVSRTFFIRSPEASDSSLTDHDSRLGPASLLLRPCNTVAD